MREFRALLGPVSVVALVGAAILWSPFEPHRPPVADVGPTSAAPGTTGASWDDRDWGIFYERVQWAMRGGLDTLPIGTAMVELGRSFVGAPYVPQTLEVDDPERLVINFRGLDCVTFVENMFAMSRFIGSGGADLLNDRSVAEDRYEALLSEHRYRNGEVDEYPSRLHYFTDWIGDNERRGLVADVTVELGGVLDNEPIEFMSSHPDAYRQLADPSYVEAVEKAEERLSAAGRHFVPKDQIDGVADRIRDGDIIAATSTVAGLDVAHTGLALWVGDELHLLHAPLVGEAVQISEVPLARRILDISSQDGIIVARPQDDGARGGTR
jgi:hypothetical protein